MMCSPTATYGSAEFEAKLRASGYKIQIHRRGRRNHPLSLAQERANHAKSRIRARIEHVFGAQQSAPVGRIVRTIGVVRCIRCALCVKRCPFDAITMERFELQEISTDGRLYKESYRDAQLAGTPGVAGGAR